MALLSTTLVACRAARTEVADSLPGIPALVGESYVEAQEPSASAAASGEGLEPAARLTARAAGRWWRRFEDPVLDELIGSVLAGNLDLVSAAARVREVEARVRSAHGARGPQLDAALPASRRFDRLPSGEGLYSNAFTPQLSISWQADLFGRLAAAERADVAELFASEADQLSLAHSLVAQAARLRIAISVLARQLRLASEVVESRGGTLEVVEGRYERGLDSASAVDVHQARENLASARTALPSIERALRQNHLALDLLIGRKPGVGAPLATLAEATPESAPPPAGVPLALLDRRPDLQAARHRLEAAAAEVDVSLARLYPELTLSATMGWSSGDLEDVLSAENFFASLLANLSAPLFSSGRLQADVEAARARLEGLAATYAASVLAAVREVEDALVAERLLREELKERTSQREEALLAESLARDRYGRGLTSLLTVLDTERRRASAEDAVLRLQADVWNARIDLHLALGGDWFREDPARPAESELPEESR